MKVLIATVTAGAGHVQAAGAVEEAWRARRPGDEVHKLDVLEFTPRLFAVAYSDGYAKVVEKAPEAYAYAFRKSDDPEAVRKFGEVRRLAGRVAAAPFLDRALALDPDVVVCTHFMPPEILGRAKEKGRLRAPIVSVVTDFEAHALWLERSVDLTCVAFEETKARLVARGVAREAVAVTGIPVAAKFGAPPTRAAARKRLELHASKPCLLVLGGGFGMGPVERVAEELGKVTTPLQAIVVCGRNEELYAKLRRRKFKHPTKVLGFAGNMHELMAAADLIVTKPGGLTSSEALAVGRPLLVCQPIPGQEEANSDFLLERGAAAKASRLEDLAFRVERLLDSPELDAMAAAAKALGSPKAADRVCELALSLAENPPKAARSTRRTGLKSRLRRWLA